MGVYWRVRVCPSPRHRCQCCRCQRQPDSTDWCSIYLCSGQRDGKWHLDGILVFSNTFQFSSSHQDIGPWDVKLFPWRKREEGSEDGPGVLRDAKDLPYRIWLMHVKATASGTLTGMCGCARCLLYTSPSPRDKRQSRMPSSA